MIHQLDLWVAHGLLGKGFLKVFSGVIFVVQDARMAVAAFANQMVLALVVTVKTHPPIGSGPPRFQVRILRCRAPLLL